MTGVGGTEDPEGRRGTTLGARWYEQGANFQLQRQGAKVGCLVHRTILCDSCEKDVDKAGSNLLGRLRKKAVEEPRNPLFPKGVPLMPCTGLPPPYVEVKSLGADDDNIAHGKGLFGRRV